MVKNIKAKFGTELRELAMCALAADGLAGPNYSLDGVSAYIRIDGDSLHITFWDMDRYITSKNKYYKEIMDAANAET